MRKYCLISFQQSVLPLEADLEREVDVFVNYLADSC
jgi:hypothetical protein